MFKIIVFKLEFQRTLSQTSYKNYYYLSILVLSSCLWYRTHPTSNFSRTHLYTWRQPFWSMWSRTQTTSCKNDGKHYILIVLNSKNLRKLPALSDLLYPSMPDITHQRLLIKTVLLGFAVGAYMDSWVALRLTT